ncbi:MAG: hypothetical protein ACK5P7_05175 [Bdellovibrio sp.]
MVYGINSGRVSRFVCQFLRYRLVVTAVTLAAASPIWAAPKVVLQYASGVPASQSERLNADLVLLDSLKFKDVDGEAARIYKVPAMTPEYLQPWLQERAQVILGEDFTIDEKAIAILDTNVMYPNPDLMPQIGMNRTEPNLVATGPLTDAALDQEAPTSSGPMIIMSNVGGILYLLGKQNNVLMGLNVDGIGTVPVKSARAGIFQIGAGLFVPIAEQLGFPNAAERLYSFFRLGTLFHESRHSDGNGKTALFAHAACPVGHNLEGMPACDVAANGPYRMDALFLQSLAAGMDDLTVNEKEVLALLRLDSESRVISPLKLGDQPRVESPDAELCVFLKNMGLIPDFCAAQEAGVVVEWDDTPESLQ